MGFDPFCGVLVSFREQKKRKTEKERDLGKTKMREKSPDGVAGGEEERSARSGLGSASVSHRAWRGAGPSAPDAQAAHLAGRQGWLSEGNPELWWKQRERKEERKGLDFLTVQTLRMCWCSALLRLGKDMVWDVPTLGVPRDAPWSWGAPTTLFLWYPE